MGRKGVSKRKPSQTKSKPFSNDKSSGSVASAMAGPELSTAKTTETGKGTYSTDKKKTSQKR